MRRIILILFVFISLFARGQLRTNSDLEIAGDLKYNFPHIYCGKISMAYTPTMSVNVPIKLAMGLTYIDGNIITQAGDSIYNGNGTGDFELFIFGNIIGTSGDDYILNVRVNNVDNGIPWTGTMQGGTNYTDLSWMWYLDNLPSNAYISFWLTNITNNNDPTIQSFKLVIKKLPE